MFFFWNLQSGKKWKILAANFHHLKHFWILNSETSSNSTSYCLRPRPARSTKATSSSGSKGRRKPPRPSERSNMSFFLRSPQWHLPDTGLQVRPQETKTRQWTYVAFVLWPKWPQPSVFGHRTFLTNLEFQYLRFLMLVFTKKIEEIIKKKPKSNSCE